MVEATAFRYPAMDGWAVKEPFPLQGGKVAEAVQVPEIMLLLKVP